jgi:hypothetical protein
MLFFTVNLFLPFPAVPYSRISLLIVMRWKSLPPRHYCDTQAHLLYSCCPCLQRLLAKRGKESLCHSRTVPDCTSDLPRFTLCSFPYMPSSIPRRAALLHLSVSSWNASVFACGTETRHPQLMSTPISTGFTEDTQANEAAMFA